MRAFLMCAILTVAALTVGATSAQAHEYYHGFYHRRPIIVLPAPIIVGPAPIVVAPAPIVVGPAPVIVQPVVAPIISLRIR